MSEWVKVVDCCVVVSALLLPTGNRARVLGSIARGRSRNSISPPSPDLLRNTTRDQRSNDNENIEPTLAPRMKLAEFLSDLTSLQVCVSTASTMNRSSRLMVHQDPNAALALVSARPDSSADGDSLRPSASKDDGDVDLKRAKDLLDLHGSVKLGHQDGTDHELNTARDAVAKVLRDL